ncbi:MAG: molecular chaperone of family [Planctomycetaceae bacterium]|nr:molecular chaperone of family [Planctomycetaceae bacterium]
MSSVAEKQEFTFQTEIKQLLHLLSHSLYQNKEITIRELISNASDALDKLRHIQLTDEKYRDGETLQITIEPDKDGKILTIRDNGIGLTHDELVKNLGTIAHSGSLEFLSKLSADNKNAVSLIGQFGVGFYSAFMLADRVEVLTRSYADEQGWRWESEGTGNFSIQPADDVPRGAQIRLHLKADLVEDFTSDFRLKHIIQKYSTFVPHPIMLGSEKLNEMSPIWVEPKSQVKPEQYEAFYQYISHRTHEKPLWHLHQSVDSPLQFHSILYCPSMNWEKLGMGRMEHGLHLCAKRILVQDDCNDLLPDYLQFMYGIVDSADLPLNVSRETLQDNRVLGKIKKVLVKGVLDHLAKLAENEPEEFKTFSAEFGPIVRSGISTDFENREKIAKLLRFNSSNATDSEVLTSLDEYITRAPADQEQIYYQGGPSLTSIAKNPNLEIFRRKKLEVLYLTDPVDEYVLSTLGNYNGKKLIAVDDAEVKYPESAKDSEETPEQPESTTGTPAFEKVLELFRTALGEKVQMVRESKRLTDSPCCLVNPSGSFSTQLQKVLSMNNKDYEMSKRILEVNPASPLIVRLTQLSTNPAQEPFIQDVANQLYANAMLLEGFVPDAEDAVSRMQRFMTDLASSKSSIIP